MSEQDPDRLTRPGDQSGGFGWFAYAPPGAQPHDDEDPVVRTVQLRAHEHAGPFWDDEGHLSDDFDELHRWIGISRELFDDAMAWNDELASLRPKRRIGRTCASTQTTWRYDFFFTNLCPQGSACGQLAILARRRLPNRRHPQRRLPRRGGFPHDWEVLLKALHRTSGLRSRCAAIDSDVETPDICIYPSTGAVMALRTVQPSSRATEWSWRFIFERRDLWVGLYWDQKADGQHFYLCPLPTLVFHGHRRSSASVSSTVDTI